VPASILIAEGNLLGCDLISSALKRCQNYFEVVAQATRIADAIKKLEDTRPRIVLVSANLQDGPKAGYKLISHIHEHWPKTAIVTLLTDTLREDVVEAFRCGARGVISRDQPFRVLAKCVRKVHEGEIWASSDQIGLVFESLKQHSEVFPERAPQRTLPELTPRERDVVALVIEGLRNAEIGVRLTVSEHTVRNYIMRIYDKLGVSNRVQLTRQYTDLLHPRSIQEPKRHVAP
jgi:DNA-binding NarL/FixJ family response regulator